MQENYFNKFHLSSAEYGDYKNIIQNRVTSYRTINDKLELFPLGYSPGMYADTRLNINIDDLIKQVQAVLEGKILSKKELSDIWNPVILNKGKPDFLAWDGKRIN